MAYWLTCQGAASGENGHVDPTELAGVSEDGCSALLGFLKPKPDGTRTSFVRLVPPEVRFCAPVPESVACKGSRAKRVQRRPC